MDFGGPEFVLAIIGMAMLTGVMKTSIRARHGLEDSDSRGGKKARRAELARQQDESAGRLADLQKENARLTSRLESCEDRVRVLERIVTDRSYNLASEIERLRDQRESA